MEQQDDYIAETEEALEMPGKGYNNEPIPPTEFVSTLSGFTPTPDVLVREFGFVTALVWGRVWRYCQMADGVCRASLEKISIGIGMSERTIIRHLETLCQNGYLKDFTPDLKNKPHIYGDTRKISIRFNVEAGVTESQRAMTESQRQGDRESVEESIKKELKNLTDEEADNVFKVYESEIGLITPMIANSLDDWMNDVPSGWITDAIGIAVKNNARAWAYIEVILRRWKAQGNQNDAKQGKPERKQSAPSRKETPLERYVRENNMELVNG